MHRAAMGVLWACVGFGWLMLLVSIVYLATCGLQSLLTKRPRSYRRSAKRITRRQRDARQRLTRTFHTASQQMNHVAARGQTNEWQRW